MSNPRIGQILARIADARAPDTSLPARLCAECLSALPVSGVALALMSDAGPSGVVLAATDARARQLEELQFALDEGPCVEASRGDHPVLHPELTATRSARWPRYGAAALQATGMITVQLGISLTEALLRLRAHAYDSGQSVTDIAADVVSRRLHFDNSQPDITTADR